MAYVYIDRTINSSNNEIGLGVSITNSKSLFTLLYDLRLQTKENLKTLLLTRKGERYMSPTFGTDLLEIVFQPNVSELKQDITNIISDAVSIWIPKLQLQDIEIKTNEDDSSLNNTTLITISYSVIVDSYAAPIDNLSILADPIGNISVS
jgi:phage baseplate assembly protein W